MAVMLLSFVVLSASLYTGYSHPQCLDYQPPFKVTAQRMWCKDYSRSGCCTKKDDSGLKTLYGNALRLKNNRRCGRYLSRVVCLKCHPWSAHIFNAESNPNYNTKAELPCLGYKFCAKLVANCEQAVQYLWKDAMEERNITIKDFCRESEVAFNRDYCYPRIKQTIQKLKSKPNNIANGSKLASQKGCLCVREVCIA